MDGRSKFSGCLNLLFRLCLRQHFSQTLASVGDPGAIGSKHKAQTLSVTCEDFTWNLKLEEGKLSRIEN